MIGVRPEFLPVQRVHRSEEVDGVQSHLFGVWSPVKKNAPFVCIEPWYGRSDRADFDQKLEHREHGNVLAPGGEFEAEYLITV